jgi:LysM repeat protein
MPGNFILPAEGLVRALRRRLWIERVIWLALIGLLAAVHFGALPGGRRVTLIAVNGDPVTVVASRADARRLLDALKSPSGEVIGDVTFAEKVASHSVSASRNPIQSDSEAMKALAGRLHPMVQAAAIVAGGEVVLALPNQQEAVKTLSAILQRFSPPGDSVTRYFKEEVKVETRSVPVGALYPTANAALERIIEASRPKAEYEVRPGDSAWKIAQKYSVPLSRLGGANPGMDLNRVRAGERLKIPGELPPITIIARKEIKEPISDEPGAPTRKVRISYENGAEVSRQVIGRPPRRTAAFPRPGRRYNPGEIIR